jgi:hypothetical protein
MFNINVIDMQIIWIEGDYDIQTTHFCLNTREKRINGARLKFSLYTNCQNRACGKEIMIKLDIFLFSRTWQIYIFLTFFSKLLISFYLIRTLFFQLSFGHNGQLRHPPFYYYFVVCCLCFTFV